jgi:hypothetical protein
MVKRTRTIMTEKIYTRTSYKNYMTVVNKSIAETERRMKTLEREKKVSKLKYSDWVKFQKGELNI